MYFQFMTEKTVSSCLYFSGKIFGKGYDQSLVTPRKALGDVNRDLKAINNGSSMKPLQQQNKGLQMKSSNRQPFASRSANIMQV